MDKIGESDFSPGSENSGSGTPTRHLLPPSDEVNKKQRGFAARFSRPSSSSSSCTGGISSFFHGRKSTSPLVPHVGVPMEDLGYYGQGVSKSPAPLAVEESSDSENDHDPATSGFNRKVSTNKDIKNTVSLKEGYLMKQTSSFQRWHKRYFKIKGKKLFYGKDEKAQIFDEIDLSEITIAESSSSKSCKHCFQVITPHRVLNLGTEKRADMEEWMTAVRSASDSTFYESGDHSRLLSGTHIWYATSHARPTYCNICREQLCGVTSHGLSCEICKFKAHKRCASKAQNNCKWTTLASMGKEIIEENDGVLALPHQWLEGNLPVSAKCDVCEKTCGSVLRLQDWRCLWCRTTVHNNCKALFSPKCSLGRISVVSPTALHTIGSDDAWEATTPLQGCSPLLVFVNSKSGDHQGLKFLRRFKQLLNPAQVFDLMNGGPRLGLQLFRHFEPFRILVCGGDGSVGWVMAEIDRLDMHRQCQVGVLPLGTGNDLARVLGWGASCDDDAHLPHLLEKYEKATTKMLDRWSVLAFESGVFLKPNCREGLRLVIEKPQIAQYEDSVVSHLQNILQSNQHQTVINSAKVLCETVRDMIGKIGSTSTDSEIDEKCANLSQKLNSLLQTLNEETEVEAEAENREVDVVGVVGKDQDGKEENGIETKPVSDDQPQEETEPPSSELTTTTIPKGKTFRKKEVLMLRANSLKKAVRQIIEHAERTLDETTTPPPIVIVRPMTLSMQQEEGLMKAGQDECQPLPLTDMQTSTIKIPVKTTSLITPNNNDKEGLIITPNTTSSDDGNNLNVTSLPVPKIGGRCDVRKLSDASTNSSIPGELEMEDEIADEIVGVVGEGDEMELLRKEQEQFYEAEFCPKIEIESPSSSSPQKTQKDSDLSEEMDVDISLGMDSSIMTFSGQEHGHIQGQDDKGTANLFVPGTSASASGSYSAAGPSSSSLASFHRGASPRASRRISMGSLFKPLEVDIPTSPECFSSAANSAHSSPNKSYLREKRKTLPIVNPLVNDPSWPSIASGGVVSKVLLANADAICAVASPLMDPGLDHEELMIGFDEKCVMNNYFGIGIDAKITLDFHLKREEHPEKCRSRTRNFVWYGVLGGKEFLQKSCKNLEQKVRLECDGRRLPLPSLQGIVILNIQSFMGGTNFWGGTKEDDCFLAPSFDDRILEVVAVFDTMQMAASRLINLQHHRIAQCQNIKITILGDEPIPVQVDGEAWLQAPGVIRILHKNRMQMLCRNRALESSLKSWEEKQKHQMTNSATHSPSPTPDTDELGKKRHTPQQQSSHSRGVFKLKFHRKDKEKRRLSNEDYSDGGVSISDETGSFESKPVEKWTATEVTEWLEYLSLSEYKTNFLRHDIQGSELVTLQRRDLRELGVTKVGHIKRILHSVERLQSHPHHQPQPLPSVANVDNTNAKYEATSTTATPSQKDKQTVSQEKPQVSKQTSL